MSKFESLKLLVPHPNHMQHSRFEALVMLNISFTQFTKIATLHTLTFLTVNSVTVIFLQILDQIGLDQIIFISSKIRIQQNKANIQKLQIIKYLQILPNFHIPQLSRNSPFVTNLVTPKVKREKIVEISTICIHNRTLY